MSAVKNRDIPDIQLKILDENKNFIGSMSRYDAIKMARERQSDLICRNPDHEQPVCFFGDFGKFLYEEKKKAKETVQKRPDIKEIQIKYSTDDHDLTIKANRAKEFLQKGHHVRISLSLRGRERQFKELALKAFHHFLHMIGGHSIVSSLSETNNNFTIQITKQKDI